jgi:muconate cycloisomerase
MKLTQAKLWHLKLPFLQPFKHSLATHEDSENLVVQLLTAEDQKGYGEGIPREFVTGETLEESLQFLRETLIPAVLGQTFATPESLWQKLADLRQTLVTDQYPAAICALEMALLDAAGQTWRQPLVHLLNSQKQDRVVYSVVLPLTSQKQLAGYLQVVKQQQIRFLKLKVGTPEDLGILKLAREVLGWEVNIRVDANAAWDPETGVVRIQEMQPYGISAVEQPVAGDDKMGLRQVRQAVDIPVIADESLCTLDDARELIELGACQIFNIRLSKCGGLGNALRIKQMAEAAGILCQLGCHVGETSILSAAGRHFALAAPDLVFLEGSMSQFLLARDTCKIPVAFGTGGVAAPLDGFGLGIAVQEQALEALAVNRETLV